MIEPIPMTEESEWLDAELLDDLAMLENGDVGELALRGEGEIQGPDDEIGRAFEDLDALTESA